jgi:hypothetical protein
MYSDRLHHRIEGVSIVNTIMLFETLGHQTSFITINSTISLCLDFINTFAINNISSLMGRN